MKKLVFSAMVLVCLVVVVGAAGFRSIPGLEKKNRVKCVGYTIIEFDKGIDCYGDTIKLVRRNGFAEKVVDI